MKNSYIETSDWSKCTGCGECLMKCPVMGLDEKTAKEEIHRLLKGEPTKHVLQECTLCYRCDDYCPIEGLYLYDLITERISEKHPEKIPFFFAYILNGQPINLWKDLYSDMFEERPKTRGIIDKWSEIPDKSEDVLWVGCVGRTICDSIDSSKVMAELPKYGPLDLCCGELQYRLGKWKAYTDIIKKTAEQLKKLKCERLVTYCGSCNYFLGHVYPKVSGEKLPFETISIYQWLYEKAKAGEIEVVNPINLKAAIQESCYISATNQKLDKGMYYKLKELYEMAGMEVEDLPHHGDYGLSCGLASTMRDLRPTEFLKQARRKYKEVEEVGMKDLMVNCPGCFMMFGLTSFLPGIKVHYAVDHLLKAFGDDVDKPLNGFMNGFVKHLVPGLPFIYNPTEIV